MSDLNLVKLKSRTIKIEVLNWVKCITIFCQAKVDKIRAASFAIYIYTKIFDVICPIHIPSIKEGSFKVVD